jgi:hypothetical protein
MWIPIAKLKDIKEHLGEPIYPVGLLPDGTNQPSRLRVLVSCLEPSKDIS